MNEQAKRTVDTILAADRIDRAEMQKLELACGEQLLSRIAPIPSTAGGLVLYDAAAVRKLIEAGMIPQTR